MSPCRISTELLAAHFKRVLEERMRDIPIVNPALEVETVGFTDYDGRPLGVLITPWFMNLVMLPVGAEWLEDPQGEIVSFDFPRETIEFTVSKDDELGAWLSAILYRSMTEMPDQETARAIALEIMKDLFVETGNGGVSRRALFTGLGAS